MESLAAEIVHGAPYRVQDLARFSLAHGGKDRQPFPVPIRVYDETIRVMKSAVQKAKLGRQEELTALKRLDVEARKLERVASGPSLASFVGSEIDRSHIFDGRSVFGAGKAHRRNCGDSRSIGPRLSYANFCRRAYKCT